MTNDTVIDAEKAKKIKEESTDGIIRIEVEIEDRELPEMFEIEGGCVDAIFSRISELAELDDLHVFEHDKDDPVGKEIAKRKALRLVAHRSKAILVTVQFEHQEEGRRFPPSATILRVLQWAIRKFKLDPTQASQANLILPGTDQPLPKDSVLGRYVHGKHGELTLVLTLKDFTNG